jgi:DNA helicase-2/ATP-dependent DNA helicase PcrA
MEEFDSVYHGLNSAQRKAVDAIDGPVLVVAGPGTGKTQLLSARVAQILRATDTLPQNILCLTFTESGALAMRERLTRFIGKSAYDVQIGTYHAFGSGLINSYPEYFSETRLERAVDELGQRQILGAIVDKLSYRNPLKQTRWHLGDLISTISEVKRGLLAPDDLRAIAASNLHDITTHSKVIAKTLRPYAARMPGKLAVAEPLFEIILQELQTQDRQIKLPGSFQPLRDLAADQLEIALADAREASSTKPLTGWKNSWLVKDENNDYMLAGKLASERIVALADVLEAYGKQLEKRGLYDYDDMILRAIDALQANPDLQYTLQERYQYLLLDEFQDTNAAQLRLVRLLTDNPANEGRPNVLAVGDDDQAIYAFQGAQYSNMLDFYSHYREPLLINLGENYRSTAPILEASKNVSAQIVDSLENALPGLDKQLVAAGKAATTQLQRTEYESDVAERAGVAEQIAKLVASGVMPGDIAVLAPKHRFLEALVPFLQDKNVPLSYERREDILQAPVIRQLLTMGRLVLALGAGNQTLADSLWPEVLSYPFWGHATSAIWQLSWQVSDDHKHWTKLMLDDSTFRPCALLFLAMSTQAGDEPLEVMLDKLIGTEEVITNEADTPTVRSPLRAFYIGPEASSDTLYRTVTELSVLRARLREHEQQRAEQLRLADMLGFADEYADAEQPMQSTSPYNQAESAVQLMTVFKSKGLEFKHVFILHAQNEAWGSASGSNPNKLTLPANLAPIRHAGSTEDERLRILFVAMTRAKQGLHITNHRNTFAGKKVTRLKYLDEVEEDNVVTSRVLPEKYQRVASDEAEIPTLQALEYDWRTRHLVLDVPLRNLLAERLKNYQLSATHLTGFVDLEHAGPQDFLLRVLLRFHSAPTVDASFGNAMHATLEWLQQQVNAGTSTTAEQTKDWFSERLTREYLSSEQFAVQEARGHDALDVIADGRLLQLKKGNKPEHNFRNEGVVVGPAHLGGKIDLLEIDEENKRITIVDYKTGSSADNPAKTHRYQLQLYVYKLLVEGSHSFRGYSVEEGKLVYLEPDNAGKVTVKHIKYDSKELDRVKRLLSAMWTHVQSVDMPDISKYGATLTSIKQFEEDLLQ